MKTLFKRVLATVFETYELNRVYRRDLAAPAADRQAGSVPLVGPIRSMAEVQEAGEQRLRDHAWYFGERAAGYGIWDEGQLVCLCWIWRHDDPRMPASFQGLPATDAVLVDVLTATTHRGRNLAAQIIQHAEQEQAANGVRRMWAWIWHSNHPSIRTFSKAGWSYSHFLVVLKLRGLATPLRLRLPRIGR
jgi:GNAT superfamily N-acetyltransferase